MKTVRWIRSIYRVPRELLETLDPAIAITASILNSLAVAVLSWAVLLLTIAVPFFIAKKVVGLVIGFVTALACLLSLWILRAAARNSQQKARGRLERLVRRSAWILIATLSCVVTVIV